MARYTDRLKTHFAGATRLRMRAKSLVESIPGHMMSYTEKIQEIIDLAEVLNEDLTLARVRIEEVAGRPE